MRGLSRFFAATLLLLSFFVALSLVCSWRLGSLVPQSAASGSLSSPQSSPDDAARHPAPDADPQTLRSVETGAQLIALGLCCLAGLLGMTLPRRSAREAARLAMKEFEQERQTTDKRIEERARELVREAEKQRRDEGLNRGQKQVIDMVTDPRQQKTEEILRYLVGTLAAHKQGWDCSLHRMDRTGKILQLVATSAADETVRQYLVKIGTDFPDAPEGQASCSGRSYVVEDLTTVQRPWSELLAANGICSAWSVPVRKQDKVAGTLTVYSRLKSGPSPSDLELAEASAALAGLILEYRRLRDELTDHAHQDELTGILNRRGGVQALESAIETAQQRKEPFTIFWIDLERFKRINDQHGPAAGDEVLGAMARRLGSHPLVNGNLARMGGDEFMALIPGAAAAADPAPICDQLIDAIAAPVATSAGVLSVAAKIGVCCYPRDGVSTQSLERNADFAMNRAKSAGDSFCIFSAKMDEEVSESLELEEALRVAVESKQLRLLYQPIYSPQGVLHGFEALMRFRNPKLGDVSPVRFIPKAEETGLIVPIGEWALRQACRQLHTWLAAGSAPIRMGVNISAVQIARNDFADTVAGILKECSVPPELLTLELTETAMMQNPEAATTQMFLLKKLGIHIALDDFGTGYSSLNYLHKLPLDVVKIDRSFTERLTETEGTRSIVEAIIGLAHHLRLEVVAEGVETEDQRLILEEAGCKALQGYLFARPLPPEEAQKHLAAAEEDREPVRVIRRVAVIPA